MVDFLMCDQHFYRLWHKPNQPDYIRGVYQNSTSCSVYLDCIDFKLFRGSFIVLIVFSNRSSSFTIVVCPRNLYTFCPPVTNKTEKKYLKRA